MKKAKGSKLFNVRLASKELPTDPGVYSFLDCKGTILYIGKARNLRKRVAQYTKPHSWLIPAMLEQAQKIDFTITQTEREALILEAGMVRHYRPRYNVRLKDDKRFPYIKITKEKYPRILYVRRPANDSARYFGPFVWGPINKTLRFVRKLFGIRPCTKLLPRGCVYGDIGVCLAPCRSGCTDEEYTSAIEQASKYLSGDHCKLMNELEERMNQHSELQEFEKAAGIRDQIHAISRLAAQQRVDFLDPSDRDATVVRRISDERAMALHYAIRNGTVVAKKNFSLDINEGHDVGQILEAFMMQYYGNAAPPPEIIVPETIPDKAVMQDWLSSVRGKAVKIVTPKKGPRKKLLDLMGTNLETLVASIEGTAPKDAAYKAVASELQRLFGLDQPPLTIEAYDISTIQGSYSVGSKVRFDHGVPDKSGYRRFKIKTVKSQDDFAMMEEVVTRRLNHKDDDPLPDLLLIDGGKGQLASALVAAKRSGVSIPMVALAKQEEELFLPGANDPIKIPSGTPAKLVLMRARDEAHRFAVTYHRKVRSKGEFGSALDNISGLGESKKRALLTRFSSVRGIRAASEDELANVDGIGPALAKRIKGALNS
jgi:excinuclease ABC subunit C